MKKITNAVFLLLAISLFACKGKDDEYVFPYTGKYQGTFSSAFVNGTWTSDITADGKFIGKVAASISPTTPIDVIGTVSNTGKVDATYTLLTNSVVMQGQITGTNVSGTWTTDTLNIGGTWTGSKQQ